MTEGDNELVQLCLKENAPAQKRLYELFASKMNGVCYRYARNGEDARDILQEGFIKVFTRLKSFKGDGPLEAWIRRIMVNTALDFIKARSKNLFDDEEKIDVKNHATNPEVMNKLQSEDLVNCISKLPEGFKAVFNLYAIEGFSHKEVGELLGITESTSRSQYTRARTKLEQIIQQRFKVNEYERV